MSHLSMPIIETKRLILRPIALADAADMFDYASHPKTVRFLTFPPHRTIDDSKRAIREIFLTRMERGLPEAYAIVDKQSSKMIGTCDIVKFVENEYAEIGYVLHPNFHGKGLMTEACQAVIGTTFMKFPIQQVQVQHALANFASQRVIEKCGFQLKEIRRDVYHDSNGKTYDTKFYTILRKDYCKEDSLL
jgi:ribosomal-protein-alanine N-acetyltransferase